MPITCSNTVVVAVAAAAAVAYKLCFTWILCSIIVCFLCCPFIIKQAVREAATICPRPMTLTFDLLTLKVVSESRVTWATSVPILVFLDSSSVLDLVPMYATDRQTVVRQTDVRQHHRLIKIKPLVILSTGSC